MLSEGVSWGGLTARGAAELVEQLVELMCYQRRGSLVVRLSRSKPRSNQERIHLEIAEVR